MRTVRLGCLFAVLAGLTSTGVAQPPDLTPSQPPPPPVSSIFEPLQLSVSTDADGQLTVSVSGNSGGVRSAFERIKQIPDKIKALDFSRSSIEKDVFDNLAMFTRLGSLKLGHCSLRDEWLSSLSGLRQLHTLDLQATRISDSGLAALAKLENLEVLDLSHTEISDAGLKHLVDLRRLRTLDLGGTRVRGSGLASFRSLRVVRLSGSRVTDETIRDLSGLTNLGVLDLSVTRLSGDGLAYLTKLKSLRELDLRGTRIAAESYSHLSTLSALNNLRIMPLQVTSGVLRILRKNKQLHTLAHNSQLRGSTSQHDSTVPTTDEKLRHLDLTGCPITDDALRDLVGLESLQSLSLAHTLITDDGLKIVSGLRSLRRLALDSTDVTAVGLKHLAPLQLTSLSLSPDQLTDKTLRVLIDGGHLHCVDDLVTEHSNQGDQGLFTPDVPPPPVDIGGGPPLSVAPPPHQKADTKSIPYLDLRNTRITGTALRILNEVAGLETLDLRRTSVAIEDVLVFATNKSLRTVIIDSGDVTDTALRNLLHAGLLHLLPIANGNSGRARGDADIVTLDLSDTAVTADVLRELRKLRGMRSIKLNRKQVLPNEDTRQDSSEPTVERYGVLPSIRRDR